jgi:hypothetical protein
MFIKFNARDVSANACHKAVAMLIISVTAQQIFGGLYFVFTRCLKMSTGCMALSMKAKNTIGRINGMSASVKHCIMA